MIAVLASELDEAACGLVDAWSRAGAVLISAPDLCTRGWVFDPLLATDGTFVAGGSPHPVTHLRGVVVRRPAVAAEELTWIIEEDRRYVAAEINAFLVAWLGALRCSVLNRPSATSLSGPAWSQTSWQSVDRAMVTWADGTSRLVVNPPAAMAVNNSKPYQLRLIAGYGFPVPDTLVTTDPEAVRAFAARHGRLVYKSVSGVRSIVNILADASNGRVEDVANAPTQFQEYVPGVDVRVHVVGNDLFATEVRSDAHDYRYASLGGHGVELAAVNVDPDVGARCCAMAAGMRLAVAGVDLRRTPDNRWVCFEVNPSPAFVYYEQATGQPIAHAVADLLARADEARRGKRHHMSRA